MKKGTKDLDITGNRYHRWVAIKKGKYVKKNANQYWICKCDCGTIKEVSIYSLLHNKSYSCGCYSKQINSDRKIRDHIGERFGKLLIVRRATKSESKQAKGERTRTAWLAQCDCGNVEIVRSDYLHTAKKHMCSLCRTKYPDITGKMFGKWKVLEFDKVVSYGKKKRTSTMWKCLCTSCNTMIQSLHRHALLSKNTTQCRTCAGINSRKDIKHLCVNSVFLITQKNAESNDKKMNLTKKEVEKLIFSNCYYCGSPPTGEFHKTYKNGETSKILRNGIDRIDSNKGYIKSNVVPCCSTCNYMKNNLSQQVFLDHIEKIAEFQRGQ